MRKVSLFQYQIAHANKLAVLAPGNNVSNQPKIEKDYFQNQFWLPLKSNKGWLWQAMNETGKLSL